MLPKGFFAKGIRCGIKKGSSKKDLALFYSQVPAKAEGMFTNNLVKAAPVLVSAEKLRKNKSAIRAVVANSGCANACTGRRGINDSKIECEAVAKELNIDAEQVLVASTGVIGAYLPLKTIEQGIEKLSAEVRLESDENSAAEAIMTTDTVPKTAKRKIKISGKEVSIWGCAKGSGMIGIDMSLPHATMLSFILTDASIAQNALRSSFENAVNKSFNCVTVDGDTSTNDTSIILANSEAKNKVINTGTKDYKLFSAALAAVCLELAKMLAKDGEGATKLVEIKVSGAKAEIDAKKIAYTIANSPLVKTAVFGCDANWGRILAATGRAGIKIDPLKVDIYFGKLRLVKNGAPAGYSEKLAKNILSKKEVVISINLNSGKRSASYYTCDLSFDYIKINASYRS
jgi:glutamate N-acetyltransferase/amino-acid N-acetyltransferase